MRTDAEHLDAWELIDQLGYDGLGFNEHHCSPYGLINSPNLMAASAAQRAKRCKLLLSDSRARFEEAFEIVTRAWTEDVFSYEGKFWSYEDVAL